MIIKLTETFYVDDESIQTIQFHKEGDLWCSPTVPKITETYKGTFFDAFFKRRTPVRLVGSEAEEAWANWRVYADKRKQ
jgi:hypothetical protein